MEPINLHAIRPSWASYDACEHRVATGCMLTALPCCCSCADRRPEATSYPTYIDGQGMVMKGKRYQRYCRSCRDYWFERDADVLNQRVVRVQQDQLATTSTPAHVTASTSITDAVETDQQRVHRILEESHRIAAERARRREFIRNRLPLGSRDDVQQDDYESPIFGMFNRAWTRYRDAEEVRSVERMLDDAEALEQDHVDVDDVVHNSHMLDLDGPARRPLPGPFRFGQRRRDFHAQFYGSATASEPQRHVEDEVGDDESCNQIDRQVNRPTPISSEDLKVDFACKVCKEQKIDSISMPCMHAAMCHWCSDLWKSGARDQAGRFNHILWTCIICRKQVKEQRRFYM